ncbi:GNAT family N-acetyltransferase [Adhaeribacter sp. BT258]|uniref:GNAT family N-acetyltransferase n=1 Tax=Adhaeribacter terrigena TaxID=2793070 RepID=A0ABS1BZC3_9BACT|nr:GNAT family N-acetyltransferase [Adhaeribacter terrigena]MBK0402474.1 GNAT family N-acetyltransferase [Adhaeribacter terrigena]
MEIRTLKNTAPSQLVACFNEAFSDYFVPVSATEEAMQNRWRASRVDFNLSVGAFENDKLVAFIFTGVGELNGHKTAYNAGTGVIPAFRGRKLVSELYHFAIPLFKNAGITQCTLEVITQNEKAIKAYRNVGFEIGRTLHCYQGEIQPAISKIPFEIKRSKEIDFEELKPLQPFVFAWDFMNDGIKAANNYECWQLSDNNQLKAYLLLNPATGYIAQLGFDKTSPENYGLKLLQEVARMQRSFKINNVDAHSPETIKALSDAGLVHFISQYEMRKMLT